MIRPVLRRLLRQPIQPLRTYPRRRLLSTAPPAQKSRSWKSSAVRWGLAIGGIYYYNTSNVFAEEPVSTLQEPPASVTATPLSTLESLSPSSRTKPPSTSSSSPLDTSAPLATVAAEPSSPATPEASTQATPEPNDPPDTEPEPQGAFNEETGEINWDCPCLGGMAHGPCGETFRAAFSCFVHSKEEPKGMDCIEKFKGMQECFKDHPAIYGAELEDDDEDGEKVREVGEGKEAELAAESAQPVANPPAPNISATNAPQTHTSVEATSNLEKD